MQLWSRLFYTGICLTALACGTPGHLQPPTLRYDLMSGEYSKIWKLASVKVKKAGSEQFSSLPLATWGCTADDTFILYRNGRLVRKESGTLCTNPISPTAISWFPSDTFTSLNLNGWPFSEVKYEPRLEVEISRLTATEMVLHTTAPVYKEYRAIELTFQTP